MQIAVPEWMLNPQVCDRLKTEDKPRISVGALMDLRRLIDVDDHVPLGLLHFRNRMRLQPQLLSQKRFDEHLDPLPSDGLITTALKGLDESGIQAAYSDGNLLHLKPFNLNFTFGIRTQKAEIAKARW